MNTEKLANILLSFFANRLNFYLNIACVAIIIIAIIAFFIKKKAVYPVPVSTVITPSLLLLLILFMGNWFNLVTFIAFSVLTVSWILFLIYLNFGND